HTTLFRSQVGESLVDAVNLRRRYHTLDHGHHPLAHVTVQRIVARERDDTVAPKYVPDLVVWLPHFYVRLGVSAASDHTAVIVAQHYDGHPAEVRPENPLAAGVKAVAVDQRNGPVSHGGNASYSR